MALFMIRMQQCNSSSAASTPNFQKIPTPSTSEAAFSNLPLRVLEKVMNEPTIIDYEDTALKKATPEWLSPNYIDLHLRSARLVSCEAKTALLRHFERPQPRHVQRVYRNGERDSTDRSPTDISDPLWEPQLTVAYADEDKDRSFLDEAFC